MDKGGVWVSPTKSTEDVAFHYKTQDIQRTVVTEVKVEPQLGSFYTLQEVWVNNDRTGPV